MRRILMALMCCAGTAAFAADPAKLPDDKSKASYTFGYRIGTNMKGQAPQGIDPATFARGIQDGMSGAKPALNEQEMGAAMNKFQEAAAKKQQAAGEAAGKRGEAYLAANKSKPGVKVLESGVQYKVAKQGEGKSPQPTDTVSVHYRGTLVNGTEFDSSYQRGEPATFPVNGVIRGWQEVLPLMKEGDKWEIVIPAALAYGDRGAGSAIGPNETLLFEIELLSVK
jgi:FKBP-type peptidyl-prolyl cis-trans isomerase FklB